MATVGNYLYGFTDSHFIPEADLRGLADAPVRIVGFRDLGAVVSSHPVERLVPRRANLEPHHRIVRHMSSRAPLVPAAFGHISDSEEEVVDVLKENYEQIRDELNRLRGKAEIGVKLCWSVGNIFEYFVQTQSDLRALRDRVFRNSNPSLDDKLKVGSLFESCLNRDRERLASVLVSSLHLVTSDQMSRPVRDEKTVCDYSFLIECTRANEFVTALKDTAALFDSHFTLCSSGPWPPYSFVRLQLQTPVHVA
jgi:hypothetical protein